MASAQQLIGLVKSHAEGDEQRFFDSPCSLPRPKSKRVMFAWPISCGSGQKPAGNPRSQYGLRLPRLQLRAGIWLHFSVRAIPRPGSMT